MRYNMHQIQIKHCTANNNEKRNDPIIGLNIELYINLKICT